MTGLRRALWALAAAGVVMGLAVLTLMVTSDAIDTPGVWAGGVLLAGWGFIGVGLYAWGRRPDNGIGLLMAATGFAWLAAAASFSDLPLVFTLAQVLGTVFFAVVLHLLLAFPNGRLHGRAERRIVLAAYLLTTVCNLVLWLFIDPNDLDCDDCPRNLILIESHESLVRTASTILNDAALVEIARRRPGDQKSLSQIRGVSEPTLRRRGAGLLDAVARGREQPPIPPDGQRPPPPDAQDAPLIALGEALVRTRAMEAQLAYELIAARADLERIIRAQRDGLPEPETRTLQGWRRELVGEELMELLAGRRSLRVGEGRAIEIEES